MSGAGTTQVAQGGGAVQQGMTTQVAGAAGAGVAQTAGHEHAAGTGTHAAGHGAEPKIPSKNSPVIQKYLADGSYGPTVKKGKAKTVQIPDGNGFGNVNGRKQNGNDKKQNNYSVTDANFYPALGVLNDAKTGKPMNYVKQIQAYNAAGYISTFHPDAYAKMVAAQDAGQGTVLGMALNMMGVDGAQTDPGMAAAGLQTGQFANEQVPGSPLNAKKIVMSGKDIAGEEWARPHHAESSWGVYKSLTDKGLDWKTSMVLSGDDAISGSGRLNGFNNQDGKDGFNDDEAAVFRMAAVVQQSTGIPAVDIVAGGHSHTGLDESAKTKPNINKLIGLNHGDTSSSPQRMALIQKALLDGTIKGGNAKKFAVDDKLAYKGAGGNSQVLQYAISQVAGAKGGEKVDAAKNVFQDKVEKAADKVAGGGPGAPDVAAGGGCSHDPAAGASLLGGGPADQGSIAAVLQTLISTLNQLIAAISGGAVAGVSGGGAPAKPVVQQAAVQPAAKAGVDQHAAGTPAHAH
ncbi:MAG: hypothetical protein JWM86_105 [Thermoleophilia bacterium]|nr:hypothetical protein [Thermoleophilia bacterium]